MEIDNRIAVDSYRVCSCLLKWET